MSRDVDRIDLYDSSVSVWEVRVDEASLQRRVFDPLIRFLRGRGWMVGQDPTIVRQYPSLRKWRRLARKGDLQASLSIHGRHLEFEIWQDAHGVTNPNGGRYEIQKLRLMPPALRRRCILEQNRIASWLRTATGYEVQDRRPNPALTAEERIAADYATNWHTDPAIGRPRYTNGDRSRQSADGQLLEQGQIVWFADYRSGRMLRGQAFYNLNNMWWVKFGPRDLTAYPDFKLLTRPLADLHRKRNEDRRHRRLREELAKAIERLDFRRAQVLARLLPAGALKLRVQIERGAAA